MQPIYCLYTGTVQSAQRVGYRLDNPRFDSWQGQEILLSKMSRSALGHTQPSIQWVPCHLHQVPAFKSVVLCVVPRYAFMTCTGTEISFLSESRRWLRHCATSPKATSLIPNVITGIIHWHNLSGWTVALGLTQPLTEVSIRNIYWRGV